MTLHAQCDSGAALDDGQPIRPRETMPAPATWTYRCARCGNDAVWATGYAGVCQPCHDRATAPALYGTRDHLDLVRAIVACFPDATTRDLIIASERPDFASAFRRLDLAACRRELRAIGWADVGPLGWPEVGT